ncbi:MAG TPA: alpha/beta fold hydrolase [Aggregatilineales bacterium]|nr:alpha/beta fold hydrolase [Anaerolineales bacterium]HRE46803.1 alpha/beta fold hydrolase [Aggregatilineales bacterium]
MRRSLQHCTTLGLLLFSFIFPLLLPTIWTIRAQTPTEQPASEEVTIPGVVEKMINKQKTTDIQGTFFPAMPKSTEKRPTVLMFPQISDGDREGLVLADRMMLDPLAKALQSRGFNVLTMDISGYYWDGAKQPPLAESLKDASAAYTWLTEHPAVDPKKIGVLGSSIGANLALLMIEQYADIVAAVVLSPAPDYGGLKPNPEGVVSRPVRLYAAKSEADNPTLGTWYKQFPEVITPAEKGHGISLLTDSQTMAGDIGDWFTAKMPSETANPVVPIYDPYTFYCCAGWRSLFTFGLAGFVIILRAPKRYRM